MQRSRLSYLLTFATFGAFCICAARADEDVKDALHKAQKAQTDAPAYRMRMVSTEANDKTNGMTVDVVQPGSIYWKTENNGRTEVELWSDGKKTYIRQAADGAVRESTIEVSSLLTQARQVNPFETLMTEAREPKFVGHEELNGVGTSVYTFKSSLMRIDSSVKLWVSDADHCPLKCEVETHRELKGASVHKKTVVTYEYGPSIKVVVPTR